MTLAALLAKSTLVLLVAWGTAAAFRRRGAATRHLAWAAGVAGAVAVPVLALLLPPLTLPLPFGAESPRIESVAPAPAPTPDTVWEDAAVAPGPAPPRATPASGRDIPWTLLYGAVALALFAPSVRSRIRLRRLAAEARELTLPDQRRRTFDALIADSSLDRRLLESPACPTAIALGWRRGRVILPTSSRDWPEARLEAVLRHELAHLDRGDSAWRLLSEIARALHWVDPLAWLAARRLCEESERACDDAVLRSGHEPGAYASHLVALAVERRWTWSAAGAFATWGALERRVEGVLDDRRLRRAAGPRARAAMGVGLLALLPLLAAAVPEPAEAPVAGTPPNGLLPVQVRWSGPDGIGGLALEGPIDLDHPSAGEGAAFLILVFRGEDGAPRTLRSVRRAGGAWTVATRAGRPTGLDPEWTDRVLADAGRKLAGLGAEVRWRGAPVGRAGVDRRAPDLAGSVMTGLPATTRDGSRGSFLAGWRHEGRRAGLFLCGAPGVDPWTTVRRLRDDGPGTLPRGDCLVAWTWDPAAGSLSVLEAPTARFTVDGAPRPIDPEWLPGILASLETPGT